MDLRGELKIKCLEKVWTRKNAELPNLKGKKTLDSIAFCWGNNNDGLKTRNLNPAARKYRSLDCVLIGFYGRLDSGSVAGPSQWHNARSVAEQEVIEGLRPHQNLKQLFLKGYPGCNFPKWTLPNLTVVELTNCKNCQHLPTLGNLERLQTLYPCGMDAVKIIGNEFYGEGTTSQFPSVRELVLIDFPNLVEWSKSNDGDAFPRLITLVVHKCPNLKTMPSFLSLEHLELHDCGQMILNSIENLNSLLVLAIEKVPDMFSLSGRLLANNCLLNSLEIISCPKLRLLPSELAGLSALKSLTIRWCEELSTFPQELQNLKSLESLEISDCNSIISIPNDGIGCLSSLRTLSIENCNSLSSISTTFQHLISLEHLTIMCCPSLGSLPDGVQHLCSSKFDHFKLPWFNIPARGSTICHDTE